MHRILENLDIKNVLITNYFLECYAGSQLVTFDIAKLFKQAGVEVTVAAFIVKEPIISLFKSIDIEIVNPLDNVEFFFKKNYDLIWGHHWPILSFMLFELEIQTKHLILGSLSPFEPFETLWMLLNESDLIWFNSIENYNKQTSAFYSKNILNKSYVLCNSLTDEWFSGYKNKIKCLQKIVVISNHLPQELKEAVVLLKERNIDVRILGLGYQQELVTPEFIDNFDAVITIGHSVQKSLARGIPIYCYDRFGGPGWITTNNIEHAEKFNFSGRCCNRKVSAVEIVGEIISGFEIAAATSFKDLAIEKHSLNKNVTHLISSINLSSEYKNFSGFVAEKKVCQAYINAKFNNIISPISNITEGDKNILDIPLARLQSTVSKTSSEVFSSVDKILDDGQPIEAINRLIEFTRTLHNLYERSLGKQIWMQMNNKMLLEAEPASHKLLQLSDKAEHYWQRSHLMERMGNKEAAITFANEAVLRAPNEAKFQYQLGNLLLFSGSLDKAEHPVQEACRLNPLHSFAQHRLGILRVKQGRYDEAVNALKQAVELQPDNKQFVADLEMACQLNLSSNYSGFIG